MRQVVLVYTCLQEKVFYLGLFFLPALEAKRERAFVYCASCKHFIF